MARIVKASNGYEQFDTQAESFVQLNVYMHPEIRRRVRFEAARRGVSMSEYVKCCILNNLPPKEEG